MNKVFDIHDKSYWLFGIYDYYPSGGMNDYLESFYNLEDLKSYVEELEKPDDDGWARYTYDKYHVLDVHTGKVYTNINDIPKGDL